MPPKNTSVPLPRKPFLLFAGLAFLTLLLHDGVLYSHLGVWGVIELASLRVVLLLIPVMATVWIHQKRAWRFLAWGLWGLFLPYGLYSLLEVRHIAEICRLPNSYFTEMCVENTWQVLPPLIYGLLGLAVFVWSLNLLTAHMNMKRAFILIEVAIGYSAVTSIFGMVTRINTWEFITRPLQTIFAFLPTFSSVMVWINVAMLWLLFSIIVLPFFVLFRRRTS